MEGGGAIALHNRSAPPPVTVRRDAFRDNAFPGAAAGLPRLSAPPACWTVYVQCVNSRRNGRVRPTRRISRGMR